MISMPSSSVNVAWVMSALLIVSNSAVAQGLSLDGLSNAFGGASPEMQFSGDVSPNHFGSSASSFSASSKSIYGKDDRREVSDSDVLHQQAARSVAALFALDSLAVDTAGNWILPRTPVLTDLDWCPEERFSDQSATATCTAFLINDTQMATSAHCVKPDWDDMADGLACNNLAVVFDHRHPAQGGLETDQVYHCKELAGHFMDPSGADWSVFELKRAVTDRPALAFFSEHHIPDGATLSVIGHPLGLPMKVSGNAQVLDQSSKEFFVSDLDTYAGNSGSPVFVRQAGESVLLVAGILSRGAVDFEQVLKDNGQTCQQSRWCDEASCQGEHVTRISELPLTASQRLEARK